MSEEDANELQLGPDFSEKTVECLTMSEVRAILKEKDERMMEENPEGRKEVFEKALRHVERLAPDLSRETAKEMRKLLTQRGLHPFEAAQLINLDPDGEDEARTLVQSLMRIKDENEIKELLDDMRKVQEMSK